MKQIANLVYLLLTLTPLLCQLQVKEIKNTDEYFAPLHRHDYGLRGFYDSDVEPNTSEVVTRLSEDLATNDYLINKNFHLGIVNLSKVPFFKNHYDIYNQSDFIFFIRNQMQRMPNFNNLVLDAIKSQENYDLLIQKVLDFVKEKIDRIAIEIKSFKQFEDALKQHKIIGIYFESKPDESFKTFYDFANGHIDFNFYCIFDVELANKIYYSKTNQEKPTVPFFALFRSDELVNKFDPLPIVLTTNLKSLRNLEAFFIPERNPKMIEEKASEAIAQRLYSGKEKLVLYVWESKNQSGVEIFEEAVQALPKKFIYSHCDIDSDFLGSYLQLFMNGGSSMTPNNLYIIHIGPMNTVDVLTMGESLTKENIMKFVLKFYRNNVPEFESGLNEEAPISGGSASTLNDMGYAEEL